MGVLSGCHDAKSTATITEVLCPKCGAVMEIFVKEGIVYGDAVCEKCKYVIKDGTAVDKLTPAK